MSNHATHENEGGATLPLYLTGFVLAIVLTLIPFGLVATGWLPAGWTMGVVIVAAIIQIFVHLYFFLHLDATNDQHWNLMSTLFTVLIMLILVGGSLWIMFSVHYRMMP